MSLKQTNDLDIKNMNDVRYIFELITNYEVELEALEKIRDELIKLVGLE